MNALKTYTELRKRLLTNHQSNLRRLALLNRQRDAMLKEVEKLNAILYPGKKLEYVGTETYHMAGGPNIQTLPKSKKSRQTVMKVGYPYGFKD